MGTPVGVEPPARRSRSTRRPAVDCGRSPRVSCDCRLAEIVQPFGLPERQRRQRDCPDRTTARRRLYNSIMDEIFRWPLDANVIDRDFMEACWSKVKYLGATAKNGGCATTLASIGVKHRGRLLEFAL